MSDFNNMNPPLVDIEIMPDGDIDEPEYESPNGSKWIVAVSDDGTVSILRAPSIHYCFTDEGLTPEAMGMPDEVEDPAGVYLWTCAYTESRDWESGMVDDWAFEPTKIELLYALD